MPSDSKFTRDDDGNVAVRVVSNTGVSEQPESMFTKDEDGNTAVRVVFGEGGGGGGGSDQHNLGWYATQAALEEAHPTAEAGDWAIVGATDTVWIWDTDNSEWVDSDQKGQVTSVNNRTGAVTVSEVPSQTGNAGKFLTTDGTDASWSDKPLVNTATGANTISILGNTGNAQQAVCVGINSDATYDGAVAIGFDADVTGGNAIAIGREAKGEGPYGVAIGASTRARGNLDISIGMGAGSSSSTTKKNRMCIGYYAQALAHGAYQFGYGTNSEAGTVCFSLNTTGTTAANDWHNYKLLDSDGTIPEARLADTTSAQQGDVLTLDSNGNAVWQAGGSGGGLPSQTGNAGKFLVTDGTDASWGTTINGAYKNIVTFSGYVPMFESVDNSNNSKFLISYSTSSYSGSITFRDSDANYKAGLTFANNGGTRKLIYPIGTGFSFGNPNAPWENIYTAKINNGSDITVPNTTGEMVVNKATDSTSVSILGESNGYSNSVAVGQNAMTRGETVAVGYSSQVESRNIAIGYAASAKTSYGGSVAIGHSANADISAAGWKASVAIGPRAKANASGSIQISATKANSTTVTPTNTDANTFKVSNDNGNYEMMSADGTIPTARLTKVNTTITLTAAGWSSNTQTVNVTGMTADGVVFPCPIPADQADYTSAGILCTAQAAGTLTFTCDTVPSGDIDVNVVML